jgi:hypothetical protein
MDFKGDKIRSTPSFGGEVKQSRRPHVVYYGMLKNPTSTIGTRRQNSAAMFLTRVSPASPLGVCWLC